MTSPSSLLLTDTQRDRLHRALEREGRSYDPGERMLRVPFSSPGYHTTLRGGSVHPVRESFYYAVALLDSEGGAARDEALRILDRLLSLQDADPSSRTYGIWPWFMEEPLEQMAPPDWNWADFCGAQLLEIALTHGPRLPAPFPDRIRAAILHAARSIERRNVTPSYTNIAIMGSFVTLAASETYAIPDLHSHALEKLRRFHAHTREQGGFSEYNSPTYTVVALDELGRLLRYAKTPEARLLAEELYLVAWKEIANHFHAPTRQWAGPQSRAYQTLLPASVRGLLHRATAGRFPDGGGEPEIDEHRRTHVCPPDLEPLFSSLRIPREFRQTFIRGVGGRPDTVGTTHLAPAFTLGSVNAGDLWNQRRTLLAYWGAAEAPSSLHVRFLHDHYDYSSAYLFSAQRGGDLLAGIGFSVDGGDRHIGLDMIKNGVIRAGDLRLRFEIEGPASRKLPAAPSTLQAPWTLEDGDFHLSTLVPHALWGESQGRWERGGDEKAAWLDVVLHAGEEKEFRLAELSAASLAVAMRCSATRAEPPDPQVLHDQGRLQLAWNELTLSCAAKPIPQEALLCSFSSSTEAEPD